MWYECIGNLNIMAVILYKYVFIIVASVMWESIVSSWKTSNWNPFILKLECCRLVNGSLCNILVCVYVQTWRRPLVICSGRRLAIGWCGYSNPWQRVKNVERNSFHTERDLWISYIFYNLPRPFTVLPYARIFHERWVV